MDPPFADQDFIKNLDLIKKNKIYKSKHIVIIHRERGADDRLENYVNEILIKKYGRSKIIFGVFI